MEFQKLQIAFIPVSGAFREDADRDTGLDQLDTRQDGFQSFFYIFPVKEETVEIMHPVWKQRYLLHLSFGNIAGQPRAAGVGEKNIKKTSVVAYIQNGFIRRNQFFANNSNFYTGQP